MSKEIPLCPPPAMYRNPGWTGIPLRWDDTIVKMDGCPDCKGRGWFLINPFATGGFGGCGGIGNSTQCQTCVNTEKYFKETGKIPRSIWIRMDFEYREKYKDIVDASSYPSDPPNDRPTSQLYLFLSEEEVDAG